MSERGHSSLSPSGAERWMKCPGSVELSKFAPPVETGTAAHRGTAAHTVLEECFGTDVDPWAYESMAYQGGELNAEDIHAVIETIDWLEVKLKYLRKKYGNLTILKEITVSVEPVHKELWGSLDICIHSDDLKYIGIFDYKHGSGRAVKPENNPQILIYLLGAINHAAPNYHPTLGWGNVFANMEVGILQPRLKRKGDLAKLWDVDSKYLDEFASMLTEKAKATDGSKEYIAGGHCYWCPAQPVCPQIYQRTIEKAKNDFEIIERSR